MLAGEEIQPVEVLWVRFYDEGALALLDRNHGFEHYPCTVLDELAH